MSQENVEIVRRAHAEFERGNFWVPEPFHPGVRIGDWRGRGKASGVPIEWHHGAVWTLREGKATDVVSYSDPADALKAAGLAK